MSTDSLIKELQQWLVDARKEIEIPCAYLFGSSIYREGMNLKSDRSDIDIILIMPADMESPIERLEWLKKLKLHKADLERKLFMLMGKENGHKEIVSMTPFSQYEISFDIHKSGVREFIQPNKLLNIDSAELKLGAEIYEKVDFRNERLIQVLGAIQKFRNEFLCCAPSKNDKKLNWQGVDVLPKPFSRTAAQVNGVRKGFGLDDSLNPSFGNDFIKGIISDLIDFDKKYLELYMWIDDRAGGRANSGNRDELSEENHILLYEILFNEASIEVAKELNKLKEENSHIVDFIKNLSYTEEYGRFIDDSVLLKKAHSEKEEVKLSEIFVFPEVEIYDDLREYDATDSSEIIVNNFRNYGRVLVAGESESGKTALAKIIAQRLKEDGLIPVYINDKDNNYRGKIQNKIEGAIESQYVEHSEVVTFPPERFLIILDDFHFANKKEKIIQELDQFENVLLLVDDIFELNFRDDNLIKTFDHFKILELKPSLRYALIKNWLTLTDTKLVEGDQEYYAKIDKLTELIDSSLGKVIGSGIMPAYPFFILSVIGTHETFDKPLDQEITSQGYCYQALIYMYLRKAGVSNDQINAFIRFLSELAGHFFKSKERTISQIDIKPFFDWYEEEFNTPVPITKMLQLLEVTNIFKLDRLGNYKFSYDYIFYYFAGHYLANNVDNQMKSIDGILSNLHIDRNAYIAIFISHHIQNRSIIEGLLFNALSLFEGEVNATLSQDEFGFFDEQVERIAEAVVPESSYTPESERQKLLEAQDHSESKKMEVKFTKEEEEKDNQFGIELRRAIKTVEVIGRVIKNRSGSRMTELKELFREGLYVHLRVLGYFVNLIKDERNQEGIVRMIALRLDNVVEEQGIKPNAEKLEKMAKNIFWNSNFSIVMSFLNKAIHSLGSDQLLDVAKEVCEEENSPASFIVYHGILMWYGKNLQIDNIANRIEQDGFSKTANSIIKNKIIDHSKLHNIGHEKKQEIQRRLKIPAPYLIAKRLEQLQKDKKD